LKRSHLNLVMTTNIHALNDISDSLRRFLQSCFSRLNRSYIESFKVICKGNWLNLIALPFSCISV